MTLKLFGTATAVVALSTGIALADCKDDLATFGERYGSLQTYDNRLDRATSTALRDLRVAANRLADTGNEEGCQAIVTTMNELVDENSAKMEKAGTDMKTGAKEVEVTVEDTDEDIEKSAENAVDEVEKMADKAGRQIEQAANSVRDRVVAVAESDMLFDTSDLRGYNVYNFQNEFLGEIDGLLTKAGNAPSHMIVGHGGFLNIGDKEAAIPLSKMMWDPTEEVFYVNMTEDQLENAPDYDKKNGKWVIDENDAYYNSVDETNLTTDENLRVEEKKE